MKKQPLNYLFYATLLDAYQNYLSSDEIYQEYWGFSEEPPHTEDEFREQQRLSLIDRINRVSFDSEAADKGTAFNEVIDCLILNQKSDKITVDKVLNGDENVVGLNVTYGSRTFYFPIELCREFSDYYKGAIPQVYTEATLPTKYGEVKLYGYIDELMPNSVHDIKTTGKYATGKFKKHWQHVVYPYCLNAAGNKVYDFEYNIAVITELKSGVRFETFTEYYNYIPEVDIPRLIKHVEGLIEFIEIHKDVITDKKIFNQHKE